ncbi:hypothetical protein [Thermococcus peptonophilus]|uniref:hypothetical protein n=1 Tax=Thermococcus peptonophilus TaxID=53952 RepID=UPI0006D16FCC
MLAISGKVEKGSRLVVREEARIQELNFIGRVKSKFRDEISLLGKRYSVEDVEEKKGGSMFQTSEESSTRRPSGTFLRTDTWRSA